MLKLIAHPQPDQMSHISLRPYTINNVMSTSKVNFTVIYKKVTFQVHANTCTKIIRVQTVQHNTTASNKHSRMTMH